MDLLFTDGVNVISKSSHNKNYAVCQIKGTTQLTHNTLYHISPFPTVYFYNILIHSADDFPIKPVQKMQNKDSIPAYLN